MGKGGSSKDSEGIKLIASNRRARFDYEISDRFEAGVVLVGSEVKTLRGGKCVLQGAHVRVNAGEAWVHGMSVPEYPQAGRFNHDPDRPRKLLLHRREIDRLEVKLREKGTAAPVLRVYFKGGRVKLEFGVGTGRKHYDKRQALKKADAKRAMDRARG